MSLTTTAVHAVPGLHDRRSLQIPVFSRGPAISPLPGSSVIAHRAYCSATNEGLALVNISENTSAAAHGSATGYGWVSWKPLESCEKQAEPS
jgi:hypothetical protein